VVGPIDPPHGGVVVRPPFGGLYSCWVVCPPSVAGVIVGGCLSPPSDYIIYMGQGGIQHPRKGVSDGHGANTPLNRLPMLPYLPKLPRTPSKKNKKIPVWGVLDTLVPPIVLGTIDPLFWEPPLLDCHHFDYTSCHYGSQWPPLGDPLMVGGGRVPLTLPRVLASPKIRLPKLPHPPTRPGIPKPPKPTQPRDGHTPQAT